MPKVLVIQTAFIGDAILTLPLIQELKKDAGTFVGVVTAPRAESIFTRSPFVDEVLVLDKRGGHKSIASLITFARGLAAKGYTKVIAPHRSLRTALLVLLTGIKDTVSFSTASLAPVYAKRVLYVPGDHEVKRNLALLQKNYNSGEWRIQPVIAPSSDDATAVQSALSSIPAGRGYVAVAPGSVWQTKRYPLSHFSVVCKELAELGYTVLILGGNEDAQAGRQLSAASPEKIFNLCGSFSIPETIECLRSAKLLISNDSAPSHFGVTAGIPVIAVYCSTVPEFGFYPYNSGSVSLGVTGIRCRPCGIHGYKACPLNNFRCGDELFPASILTHAKEILSNASSPH